MMLVTTGSDLFRIYPDTRAWPVPCLGLAHGAFGGHGLPKPCVVDGRTESRSRLRKIPIGVGFPEIEICIIKKAKSPRQ